MRKLIACALIAGILTACGADGPPVPLHPERISAKATQGDADSLDL